MPDKNLYKIVVAEDENLILNYIVKKIKKATNHFTIVAKASDGIQAFELVKQHLPHVLITDIKMPQMDGLELAEKVHNYFPMIRTIVITGHADFEYAKKAIHSNVFEYLLKPVSIDDLRHVFTNLISIFAENEEDFINGLSDYSLVTPEKLFEILKQYITDNYDKHIDLYLLAEHFGYSPAYITKVFKKYANITPIHFLTELRINTAARKLAETDLPVSIIAEQVGYVNQFYFSRVFKKTMNVSPMDYRHQQKSK